MAAIRLMMCTIATLIVSLSAWATTASITTKSIAVSFRDNGAVFPKKLIGLGYITIGDVNLADLLAQMDRVDIRVGSSLIHQQPDGFLRGSAEWHKAGTKSFIIVDGNRWAKKSSDTLPNLALHEFFGALGFGFDDKYVCSSAFDLLANSQLRANLSSTELDSLLNTAASRCSNLRLASGGSTGVAGGGDMGGVYLRKAIQNNHIRQLLSATSPEDHASAFEELLATFSATAESGPRTMPPSLSQASEENRERSGMRAENYRSRWFH